MANKFLPFIVEKSPPIKVYENLMARSKGMNTHLVTSVFNLVLLKGILSIREYVKTMEDMPITVMYEELITKFYDCNISAEELALVLSVQPHIPDDEGANWAEELQEFDLKDILCFFLVMQKHGKLSKYTDLNFDGMLRSDRQSHVLMNIQHYVQFSDDGPMEEFDSPADLKGFLMYRAFLAPKNPQEAICARFRKERNEDDTPF